MRLKNKNAIITGSARGIGRTIAELFCNEGASVVLADIDVDALSKAVKEIHDTVKGAKVLATVADMGKREDIKALVEFSISELGTIDVLVNNAGLPLFDFAIDDPDESVEERFERILDVDFKGYWYAARYIIPYMKLQGSGNIINIGSVRGHLGVPKESAYCAAKGAVGMFTKALAVEVAPFSIRVNSISPGAIQTEDVGHWIRSRYGETEQKEYAEKFTEVFLQGMSLNQPLSFLGRTMDVALAAVYIASDEARFMTGSDLVLDGGLTSVLAEPPALNLSGLSDYYRNSQSMREWFAHLDTRK